MLEKHACNWNLFHFFSFALDTSVKKRSCEDEKSDEDAEDKSENQEKSVHYLFCDDFRESS